MNDFQKLADGCPDLQFIPIRENKQPIPQGWQHKKAHDLSDAMAIGLVCGDVSGNLEAIDIDVKYDLTGNLYNEFKEAIHERDSTLLTLLVIQKTVNDGYHMIYRCDEIAGNKKLASRKANTEEVKAGEKVKVLIETRGQNGFIACAPTKGYRLVYGTLSEINKITPEQRRLLFEVAYEFNEVLKESFCPKAKESIAANNAISPFDDYDQRGDVLSLLQSHGWSVVKQKGSKILLMRPGTSSSAYSGNFDSALNRFSVFSTSTEFEAQTGYAPYAVYAYLECNKDFSEASKRLYSENYGTRREAQVLGQRITNNALEAPKYPKIEDSKSNINIVKLSAVKSLMLNTFKNGKARGETTHFESIDPHFTWKKDSLICVTGYPGHGKTELILCLMIAKSIHSEWKWAVYCPENMPADELYDSLIHTYIGKTTDRARNGVMSDEEYAKGMEFINNHFFLIDADTPTLDIVLENILHLIESEKIDGCFIDPWNQLLHNMGTREDVYLSNELLKAKQFCTRNNIVLTISAHPNKPTIEKNELPAPNEYTISGGAMWNNKCDIVLIVHRPSYHTNRVSNDVEFISRKIKKQKLIGIPGTVCLTFDRKTNRYYESNGNTPLEYIEVPASSTYLKNLGMGK